MAEPTELNPHGKQEKSPLDGALNAIHEAANKALQSKIKEQVEKVLKAREVFDNEVEVLNELVADAKEDKARIKKILAEIL